MTCRRCFYAFWTNQEFRSLSIYYYYDENDNIIYTLRTYEGRVYNVDDMRETPWVMDEVKKNCPYPKEGGNPVSYKKSDNKSYLAYLEKLVEESNKVDSPTDESSPEEIRAYLEDFPPYVGMPEEYLNDSVLGTAYFMLTEPTTGNDFYLYYRDDYLLYMVEVKEGIVVKGWDARKNPLLKENIYKNSPYPQKMKESLSYTIEIPKELETPKEVKSDPYDVYEYDDPMEFADDKYEEFYDYEDDYEDEDEAWDAAYEYWENHH